MKKYEIGQRVAYNTSQNYFSAAFIHFGHVARITKTQVILDNGMKFNQDGVQLKSKDHNFPSSYLVDVTKAEEIIAASKKNRNIRETVNNLLDALKGHKCGNGNYNLSDEIVAQIEELTKKLGE